MYKVREEVWNWAWEASHESRWPANGTWPPVKWSQNGWTNVMLLLLPEIIKEMAKLTRLVVRRGGERETFREEVLGVLGMTRVTWPLSSWLWDQCSSLEGGGGIQGRRLVVWLWWLSWQWQSTELLLLFHIVSSVWAQWGPKGRQLWEQEREELCA